MTDLRKAAEKALEALEWSWGGEPLGTKEFEAITALRQALAQDEQEPVIDRRLKVKIGRQYGYALNEHWFYLQPADEYAEQALTKHSGISAPPSKPDDLLRQSEQEGWRWAKECEAEVKRLRTLLAKDEQEPVAWMYDFLNTDNRNEVIRNWITQDTADIEREKGFNVRPLYSAPASKPWVSLTDEERSDVIGNIFGNIFAAPQKSLSLARAIEAKLKEKNNG